MILIFLDDAQWVKVECCTLESISYCSISVKRSRSELEDGRRPSYSEWIIFRKEGARVLFVYVATGVQSGLTAMK